MRKRNIKWIFRRITALSAAALMAIEMVPMSSLTAYAATDSSQINMTAAAPTDTVGSNADVVTKSEDDSDGKETAGVSNTVSGITDEATAAGFAKMDVSVTSDDKAFDTAATTVTMSVSGEEYTKAYTVKTTGGSADNYTFSTGKAKITVLRDGQICVKAPVKSAFIYNGKSQNVMSCITEDETSKQFYTSENTDIEVKGAYTSNWQNPLYFRLKDKDNYIWDDGTTADRKVICQMERAELTISYVSETIEEGQAPALELKYEGFLEDDNIDNQGSINANIKVTVPEVLEGGKTYELIPKGDEYLNNYNITYKSGTLTVLKKQEETPDDDDKSDEYTVTANLSVPGELNTQLPGVTAYMTNPDNPLGIVPDGYDSVNSVGNTYNNYSFTVEGIDYSALAAKLNQGTYDIITCPSNVSAILYNNKDLNDSVEVISINNLGLLHILTTDTSINSMEDLKGRTVYSIGEGGPPEYTFEYLLDKYGLTGQVNFSFRSTPFEVLNLLQDEPGAIALLPQPFVEVAKLLVNDLRTPIDVTKAWDELNVSNGVQSVTTVTVVRKKFLEEHRQAVEEYLEYAKKSTDYTLENVSQAAEWTEKYETFLNPDIALDAIPQCSICTITGNEMNCSVRVPVVIQSKVMTIQQLEGFSNTTLMGVERDGSGNITAVTLGLGKLESVNDTVTDTCVATLEMGDLAMSISGFSKDQIWPAQFQMN